MVFQSLRRHQRGTPLGDRLQLRIKTERSNSVASPLGVQRRQHVGRPTTGGNRRCWDRTGIRLPRPRLNLCRLDLPWQRLDSRGICPRSLRDRRRRGGVRMHLSALRAHVLVGRQYHGVGGHVGCQHCTGGHQSSQSHRQHSKHTTSLFYEPRTFI